MCGALLCCFWENTHTHTDLAPSPAQVRCQLWYFWAGGEEWKDQCVCLGAASLAVNTQPPRLAQLLHTCVMCPYVYVLYVLYVWGCSDRERGWKAHSWHMDSVAIHRELSAQVLRSLPISWLPSLLPLLSSQFCFCGLMLLFFFSVIIFFFFFKLCAADLLFVLSIAERAWKPDLQRWCAFILVLMGRTSLDSRLSSRLSIRAMMVTGRESFE